MASTQGHFKWAAVCAVVVLLALLSGCQQAKSPAAQPAPATAAAPAATTSAAVPASAASPQAGTPAPSSPAALAADVIQSQDTNTSGVVGEITQCKRSEGVLSVKVRFRNTSSAPANLYVTGPNISYEKYYVTAASKKYFILKDAEGTYLAPGPDYSCGLPGVCEKLGAGQAATWWAKFPAPPADVTKVTLMTAVAPPFEDIPIADK